MQGQIEGCAIYFGDHTSLYQLNLLVASLNCKLELVVVRIDFKIVICLVFLISFYIQKIVKIKLVTFLNKTETV